MERRVTAIMYTYTRPEESTSEGFTGYMVDEVDLIKEFDHNAIYRSKAFEEAMDFFDTEDKLTRAVLLSVNEADQNLIMQSLSEKLYKHITDKVTEVDFGTIPLSKGDITKIQNYEQLKDCINIIGDILVQEHQDTTCVGEVSKALQNIYDRTDMFRRCYAANIEFPIITYNTMALAIVSSVSLLISACIEFVKLPEDRGFDIALDKAGLTKTRESLLFKNLAKFNAMCDRGEFDKTMNFVIKQNFNYKANKGTLGIGDDMAKVAKFVGIGAGVIAGVWIGLKGLMFLIKEMIYLFFYSRQTLANYLEVQAELLEMNAYNIKNGLTPEDDPKARKKIADQQMKKAASFRKAAEKLKVKVKVAEKDAKKNIDKDNDTKYKQSDVIDSIPDSSNAVLF
jgi:hypothetical protein